MVTGTSFEAYLAVLPRVLELHRDICRSLERDGPATVSELSKRLGVFLKTVANRVGELRAEELVVATGDTRRNTRGRSEQVLALPS